MPTLSSTTSPSTTPPLTMPYHLRIHVKGTHRNPPSPLQTPACSSSAPTASSWTPFSSPSPSASPFPPPSPDTHTTRLRPPPPSTAGGVEREECVTWTRDNRPEEEESHLQRRCRRHRALPLGLRIHPKHQCAIALTVCGHFDGYAGLVIGNSSVLIFQGKGEGNDEEV
ncbi:hypothetical protein Fmac_014661 [Flemingia macrophylla]|uniref:Uncharacterized protein n=1 Tax=Flemingia macrophylla TaxID=520843 RepID=A0ABD1MCD6_9FABA